MLWYKGGVIEQEWARQHGRAMADSPASGIISKEIGFEQPLLKGEV